MMMRMASSSFGFFGVIFVLTASIAVAAAASNQFKVGDEEGWREPDSNSTDMYTRWASKMRFLVGDSIYFEYKNDSVLVVDKRGYYHCDTTGLIASFDDGKTVFTLDRPGPFYFVSGAADHCKHGQRLLVDVITPHPPSHQHPPPYPTPTSPAVPGGGPSPSPLPSAAAVSPPAPSCRVLVALAGVVMAMWSHPSVIYYYLGW